MKQLPAMILALCLSLSAVYTVSAYAENNKKASQLISSIEARPSLKGSDKIFTGNVRIEPLFDPNESTRASGAYVTFEPKARTFWHTHPTGQTLIVVSGIGRTQEWGGTVTEIRAGDVIYCPPNVKHWHGADPTHAMTHIALTGMLDGKNVEWLEEVNDAQYMGK